MKSKLAQCSIFAVCVMMLAAIGCAPARKPVPLGTVPTPPMTHGIDEQEGQKTLAELSQQYRLSSNDAQKDRLELLVARLAAAAGASNETPWHITLFEAPQIKNAAATRGNFLFVWSGLLEYLRSDEELAVVLAHELGHILAGHVMPDPAEIANRTVAQVGGAITSGIVGSSSRVGVAGDLAGQLAQMALEALVVNPGQRQLETEADEVGLFLLAKAGFDPDGAINFWERVQNDPEFGSGALAFLSTHPSSADRFAHLRALQSRAQAARYEAWKVSAARADVHEAPTRSSAFIEELHRDDFFFGNVSEHGWICNVQGCVVPSALRRIP